MAAAVREKSKLMNVTIKDPVISLDDKYRLDCPTTLINGRQALVRLPLAQRELDRRHGLKTAGLDRKGVV